MKHPSDLDLAAFSSTDTGFFRRSLLARHVNRCEQCRREVTAYQEMRGHLLQADDEPSEPRWNALASEMLANIHLGLEAGACVRVNEGKRIFGLRPAVAFASLLVLTGAGFFMHDYRTVPPAHIEAIAPALAPSVAATTEYRLPVLQSSDAGIELRTGPASFALLNRNGGAPSQSVSAQGAVRSRDIDADTGSVTIKDVYLQ